MSIDSQNSHGDTVYLGEVAGVVIENVDPLKLGRVRVRVEGLLEPESPWAFPKGSTGGGKANRGGHDVPAKGATVTVSFLGGNIDVPLYAGAWRGQGEGMTALGGSAEDATKIKTYETDRYLIVLNEVSGSEELQITDKATGSTISMKQGMIQLGAGDLGQLPLQNGVVLGSGIDTFTGFTYGALGSASSVVTAKK